MTPANLLYPLKLDVVGFKEDEYDYHFRVELAEPTCCQACGAAEGRIVKFGKDDQAYRDVPIHGKRSTIWMIRRRYKCHDCGSTFRPELKDMDDRRMMTKRLLKHIEVKARLGSNSDVARDVGVDEKTVRSIFMDYYKAKDAEYKLTVPRVLGVDELYLGKEYVAIFTNITERTVVEMLPNARQLADMHLRAAGPDMLAALERLSAAAFSRDITMGDPISLINVKAELAEANRQAKEAINKAGGAQ
jgi:transposase